MDDRDPREGPDPTRASALTSDERNFAVLAHLGALAFVVPLGNLAVPLLVWLFKRSESPFIEAHSREAMNFQLTVTLAAIAAMVLSLVLIGILLLAAVAIFDLACALSAALAASRGEPYRYPYSLRLLT